MTAERKKTYARPNYRGVHVDLFPGSGHSLYERPAKTRGAFDDMNDGASET